MWETTLNLAKKALGIVFDIAGYQEGWDDAVNAQPRKLNIGPAGPSYQRGYDDALSHLRRFGG